jgi:hypothetical protein
VTSERERAVESIGIKQPYGVKRLAVVENSATIKSTSLSDPNNPTGTAKSTSTLLQVEAQKRKLVDGVDSRFDETDLDGPPSKPAAKQSFYRDRHEAARSSSPGNLVSAGDSVDSNTHKDALQAKLPWSAHQQKRRSTVSHALITKMNSWALQRSPWALQRSRRIRVKAMHLRCKRHRPTKHFG